VENLKKHIKSTTKTIQCIDCGEWFEVNVKDNETCRCNECYSEYRKNYYREKKREQRLKLKMSTAQS
jgi:Zn finger protein HypA/HybF involved in hydrogenase expression